MSVSQSLLPQALQLQGPTNRSPSPASSGKGSTVEVDKHPEVPYEPLAISEPEVEQGDPEEQQRESDMGFKEEYQRPERRSGDAIAQLVAIVCYSYLLGLGALCKFQELTVICGRG